MSLQVASEGFSDRDRAVVLRAQLDAKLKELLTIMDEVNRAGMRAEFQFGIDNFGRNSIIRLEIVKAIA